jgi:hypothetical protein
MARASCGRRAGEVGEKDDEKAAVEEGNSDGFILEVGSRSLASAVAEQQGR